MKIYSYYGVKNFILCLGLFGDTIKDYFSKPENVENDWNIDFVDTGEDTLRGGRLKRAEGFIKFDDFFVTYGDGVSDVNINKLFEFHKKHGKIATLTSIRPINQYGILEIDSENHNSVVSFKEKPQLEHWINGGFFVFNKKIFKYLHENEDLEMMFSRNLWKKDNCTHTNIMGFGKTWTHSKM